MVLARLHRRSGGTTHMAKEGILHIHLYISKTSRHPMYEPSSECTKCSMTRNTFASFSRVSIECSYTKTIKLSIN